MANKSLFEAIRGALLPATNAVNAEGAPAYAYDARHKLAQLAVTGCLNQTFYAGAEAQLSAVLALAKDVDPLFVAKAALYAGARLLMDQLGRDTVDEVRLAGAFGSQIDPLHAMVLGLVPDCDLSRVRAAGNAAGTGALIALLSGTARREIEGVVRRVEKIETAVEPRFQEHFVEAMAIPHRTAPTTNLERVVELPARPAAGERRPTDRPLDRRRRRAVLRPVPGDDR